MSLVQALILGAVQGLTEFVPGSSTAHLFLAQALMGIPNDEITLSFDIVLHLGTVAALIASTRKELAAMLAEAMALLRREPVRDPTARALLAPIVVGTIPGVLAGLFLLKRFEAFRSIGLIGTCMLVACAYFFLAEGVSARRADANRALAEIDAADG